MELTIVCWNIKGFSSDKMAHSTSGPDIANVFTGVDVGFILEASPNLAGQAPAATLASMAGLREGDAENCGGLFGEEESVAYVRANGVTISNVTKMVGTWDASIRSPVYFDIKKASIKCRIAVWHAPPPGKDELRSGAWPKIVDAAENLKVDFLMGDFNAELSVRSRGPYECISAGRIYGTTMTNPALFRADSLEDIITTEAYDRVYQRVATKANFTVDALGLYLSPLPDLAMPRRNATRVQSKDPRRVYILSDHLPIILRIR